ncbi:hypothetical protein RJ639_022071 [Escallonia herrerae]|uniref:Pre-mRNA polyadenylation factor Fip1 domain-containing protein n=1 Tax=Escallonia herrerae TaxID=1293975 RepID=A0AA88V5N1_9ASTE|nr:hypothetical protein RJ639_022071 [Escallonia herrerae]
MEDIDDDFGDLYAGVEVQASSAINAVPEVSQFRQEKADFDEEGTRSGPKGPEPDETEPVQEEALDENSDSEDDLNIVLNNDDAAPDFTVKGGGNLGFEVEEEEIGGVGGNFEGNGGERNVRKGGNHRVVGDGLETSASVGSGERGSGAKRSYHSQFLQYKYIRSYPAAIGNNSKGNGCAGTASCSTSVRGDWEDNGYNQRMRSTSSGHNFSLPRSRTILDVNIDTFERKPWRHPGADITDFFNFGFDEESWKQFCNHLDEYRHGPIMPTRIQASVSFKSDEDYEAGFEHGTPVAEVVQSGHERRVSSTSKNSCRVPTHLERVTDNGKVVLIQQTGRAIQVEDNICERQPSMDVRRALDRDSDVVIRINVQDAKDDTSVGSVKAGLGHIDSSEHEGSLNGDFGADESREMLCFSSASEGESHGQYLEVHDEGSDTPVSKRSSRQTSQCRPVSVDADNHGSVQISDVDGHHHNEVVICVSEGTDEAIETSNNPKEKVGGDTTAGSISQGERSPTSSFSESHGASVGTKRSRPSPNSVTELRETVTYDYSQQKDVKSRGFIPKPGVSDYRTRHRSPVQEDLKRRNRRHHHVSVSKTHPDNGDASFMYDSDELYDVRESVVGPSRWNDRLHGFESYYGEDPSYCRESEHFSNYYGERFPQYQVRAGFPRVPHKKGCHDLGVKTDRYPSRNADEGEYLFEQRTARVDDVKMARDWYHYESELPVDDRDHPIWQESRQFNWKYSSYLENENNSRRKREGEELYYRKRSKYQDNFFERNYTDDISREKYRYNPCKDEDRSLLEYRYKYGRLSRPRGEAKSPWKNQRRDGSPLIGSDSTWPTGDRVPIRRYRDHQSLSSHSYRDPRPAHSRSWHATSSRRNDVYEGHGKQERYKRQNWTESCRDSALFGEYTNVVEAEESMNNPDDWGRVGRRYWQTELSPWTEDGSISRHDMFNAEGASFSVKRTSRHRRFDTEHGSDLVEKLNDDRLRERRGGKLVGEGNRGNRFGRGPYIFHRGNREQTLPRCRDSVDSDLVVWKAKSSGRCFKAGKSNLNDKRGKMDWNNDVEQTCENVDETQAEKVAQWDDLKVETVQNGEKWLDKCPVTQQNEAMDIEEGQITEAMNEGAIEMTCMPDDMAQTSNVEELHKQNASSGNLVVEGCNNPRILEMMVKMEKRRERFKEPISLQKDFDKPPKPLPDSADGTAGTKQQRPARRRRWGGGNSSQKMLIL